MLGSNCTNCGARIDASRCQFCQTLQLDEENLIVDPRFGAELGGWCLPKHALPQTVLDSSSQGSKLEARLSAQEGVAVPVTWLRGEFVDLSVAISIRFVAKPNNTLVGFWLRVRDDGRSAYTVWLWDTGTISISRRWCENNRTERESLAKIVGAVTDLSRPTRLGVTLKSNQLVVTANGRPVTSVPADFCNTGGVQLRVQLGNQPSHVVFSDPVARLQ